jgi:hypothetical protein
LRSGPGLFALIIFSLSKPTIFPQKEPLSKCKYAKNMPRKFMDKKRAKALIPGSSSPFPWYRL